MPNVWHHKCAAFLSLRFPWWSNATVSTASFCSLKQLGAIFNTTQWATLWFRLIECSFLFSFVNLIMLIIKWTLCFIGIVWDLIIYSIIFSPFCSLDKCPNAPVVAKGLRSLTTMCEKIFFHCHSHRSAYINFLHSFLLLDTTMVKLPYTGRTHVVTFAVSGISLLLGFVIVIIRIYKYRLELESMNHDLAWPLYVWH